MLAPPQIKPPIKKPAAPAGRQVYWQKNQAEKSGNASGILSGLSTTPASQLNTSFGKAIVNSKTALNTQKDEATKLIPTIDEASGSAYAKAQIANTKHKAKSKSANAKNKQNGKRGFIAPLIFEPTIPQKGMIMGGNLNFMSLGSQTEVNAQQAQNALDNIELDTSSIPDSMGDVPILNLDGDSDPNNLHEEQYEQSIEVNGAKNEAAKEVNNDFGENSIIKKPKNNKLKSKKQLNSFALKTKAPAPKAIIKNEALAQLDIQLAPTVQSKIGVESDKYDLKQTEYETKTADERKRVDIDIDKEREKSQSDQLTSQSNAQTQVDKSRIEWQNELNKTELDFNTKATAEGNTQRSKITTEQTKGNDAAQTHVNAANREAEAKKVTAQEEAKQEKANSKKSSGGFFGWVADKVSSLISALKIALNKVFDKLRKAVKWVFEQAKKLALAALELARKAIVGLIKAFGEFLKGLVNIVFAAFPSIRDRINAKIDTYVNKAEELVNKAFEFFKKAVSAILDALASFVDAILGALQAFYNLVLDVVAFIVDGLIKILAFIVNLIEGAWNSSGEFLGSMAEESLGGNPAAPLQDVEVNEGKEQAWAEAMGRVSPAKSSDGNLSLQDNELLNKKILADKDVTIDPYPAVTLDEGILQTLPPMKEGDNVELGGAGANAITTEQLQYSAAEEAGHGIAGKDEGEQTNHQPKPDWLNMSDDEKLGHHLSSMLESAKDSGKTPPSPERNAPQPSNDNTPEALITKTGRLAVSKRLLFMGKQMITGLQVFWQQYKGVIIGGLVAALLVAGIIAFFTAGTGLAAVVAFLAEALVVIFGAYAIVRATGELWNYVKHAWAGDTKAAGKSLAMAAAIIVSEFLLDKIMLGMGKTFKRILKSAKIALKGTKLGRFIRTTLAIAKRGQRSTSKLMKRGLTAIKNSKFVIRIQNIIGKGIRKLNDLRDAILKHFGFKRIWLEKHGHWLKLFGEFNSKVLLSSIDIEGNTTHELHDIPKDKIKKMPDGSRRAEINGIEVRVEKIKSKQISQSLITDNATNLSYQKTRITTNNGSVVDATSFNKHGVNEDLLPVFPSGRTAPNAAEFAGKNFPLPEHLKVKYGDTVPFTKEGFPDFEYLLKREDIPMKKVEITMSGDSALDIRKANKEAFGKATPGKSVQNGFENYTWHHSHDGKNMILVPTDIHDAVRHGGGDSLTRAKLGLKD